MATTISKLKDWFDDGVAKGATYMIVVCDTFSYEDYSVYVCPGDNFDVEYAKYDMVNMQKVMEVYNLRMSKEEQFEPGKLVFNRPRNG